MTCPPAPLPSTSPDSGAAPRARALPRIRDISAAAWDSLFPADYPFTRHAFLDALEAHGCVGSRTGWEPCHLVAEDAGGRAVGALPLYRKSHSWGEFVFDFSWAEASQQLGVPYYPKLTCAIPFTPAAGPRIAGSPAAQRALIGSALAGLGSHSSFHALFLDEDGAKSFAEAPFLERHDVQFHWRNRGDADFAGFVSRLNQDKRKKILRERRRVREAGLTFEVRTGDELTEAQWMQVYALYGNTYEERGQAPYLSPGFFLDFGRRAGTPVTLILCRSGGSLVAVAITFRSRDTLYGRHWGCAEQHHSLHFETCYYQGIELCLREGLSRFDAGTQGPHKLARGFEPVLTRSAHAIAHEGLREAVGAFLARERRWAGRQRKLLQEHSPYRTEEAASSDG